MGVMAWTRWLSVVVVVSGGAACGGNDASGGGGDSSSTDDSSSTSSTPSTSSDEADVSGSETSSEGSSSDTTGTTGDEVPEPTDARVLYTVLHGSAEQNGTWLVDVDAGVLGTPVRVSEDVAYPVASSQSRRWRIDDGPALVAGAQVRLLDLDAVPIAPASIHALGDDGELDSLRSHAFAGDESAVAVLAVPFPADSAGLFTLALDGATPATPWRADTALPGESFATDVAYLAGDDQLVVVTHDPATNVEGLALVPASVDVPGGFASVVEAAVGEEVAYMGSTHDGGLLTYVARDDAMDRARGYVVELATLPAVPTELQLPSEETRVGLIQLAPDDSGVAYSVRTPAQPTDTISVWWSALVDGVPQAPIELAPDQQVYGVAAWSHDARWMALRVDGEPNRRLLVRLDGGAPSAPIDLGPLVDTLADTSRSFTADGWHYYLTQSDGAPTMVRVDVTGDSPGEPQTVFGPVDDVIEYAISDDGSTLVAATRGPGGGDYEGFAVDLRGSEPGVPVKFNAPMAAGEWVYRVDITADGRAIAYERRSADGSARFAHYVDLATPGAAVTLADGVEIDGLGVRARP